MGRWTSSLNAAPATARNIGIALGNINTEREANLLPFPEPSSQARLWMAVHASRLAGLQKLQCLWLNGCTVTHRALGFLSRLASLRELYLDACPGIADSSMILLGAIAGLQVRACSAVAVVTCVCSE